MVGLKKWGETLNNVLCFSLRFFRALAASCVLSTKQSTVVASLFVDYRRINRAIEIDIRGNHYVTYGRVRNKLRIKLACAGIHVFQGSFKWILSVCSLGGGLVFVHHCEGREGR